MTLQERRDNLLQAATEFQEQLQRLNAQRENATKLIYDIQIRLAQINANLGLLEELMKSESDDTKTKPIDDTPISGVANKKRKQKTG